MRGYDEQERRYMLMYDDEVGFMMGRFMGMSNRGERAPLRMLFYLVFNLGGEISGHFWPSTFF